MIAHSHCLLCCNKTKTKEKKFFVATKPKQKKKNSLLQQNQNKRKKILCCNKTKTECDSSKVVVIFFIVARPKQKATTFYATTRKKKVKTILLLLPSLLKQNQNRKWRQFCCNKWINKKVTVTFSVARNSQREGLKGRNLRSSFCFGSHMGFTSCASEFWWLEFVGLLQTRYRGSAPTLMIIEFWCHS